jgi:hypothetical protein
VSWWVGEEKDAWEMDECPIWLGESTTYGVTRGAETQTQVAAGVQVVRASWVVECVQARSVQPPGFPGTGGRRPRRTAPPLACSSWQWQHTISGYLIICHPKKGHTSKATFRI